jgi:carbonic anhydrase/acetyltransferase-like protein (isoleucine patch superfamily)
MAIIKPVNGQYPQIPEDCYVAENATIVGDVSLGEACSVWFNAVIRGDVHYIKIGNKVNIQDGAVLHATYLKSPTIIGNNVSLSFLVMKLIVLEVLTWLQVFYQIY